jgi:hypothetical protein
MSEHIVHTGILEDSFAIAQYLPRVPVDFAEIMRDNLGFARLGCITVSGDQFSFRLLDEFRPLWPGRDKTMEAKFAFVLGWISHRACDRQMKPIWNIAEIVGRGSDADPSLSPTDCSVYHEGELYNQYYKGDDTFRLAIFRDQLAGARGAELFDLDTAYAYVQSAFAMNLMNIQTFSVCDDGGGNCLVSGQDFFENVCLRAQKFYVNVDRYAKAAGDPDPAFHRQFVTDINWYDPGDAVLQIARRLRGGDTGVTPEECDTALETPASGHFGQAVRLSLSYILSAIDFICSPEISLGMLKEQLDIGKKGPGGLGV